MLLIVIAIACASDSQLSEEQPRKSPVNSYDILQK